MPKVSVIIPVYNVEKYLRQCLDSVINQTLKDIEIILIDDGGKDLCPRIIDEYAAKDSRIKAIHKQNGGYGQSCNVGLDVATGEYIAIVEPDDFIEQDMYEDLYNIAKNNNADIVKAPYYENIDTPYNKEIRQVWWGKLDINNIDKCLLLANHPSIWSCIYKRDFIEKNRIKFIEAPGAGWTDNLFQVQTICLADNISYCTDTHYYWRILNTNHAENLKDYTIPFKRCNEIHQWLDKMGIQNKEILSGLAQRELAYLHTTLEIKKTPFFAHVKYIKQMIENLNEEYVLNSSIVSNEHKKLYKKLKKHPYLNYILFKIHFYNIINNIFSIRNNEGHKIITILGIKIKLKRNN